MRRFATLVAGLLVLASLSATPAVASAQQTGQNCSFPTTLTDATGTEVTIEERPDRVVTTNPSAAQTMWEIGGRDQVVGLTQYAAYLDGAESRTNVSASFGVSRETVVGTNPDLVIAPNASAGEVQGLREAGLTVYHLREAKTVDDIAEKTATIGRVTGNCDGAAETNTWMNANVETVRQLTADIEDQPTVLYSLGGGYVAGGDTFIDALFDVVGADNVAARDHSGYPQLSDEVVLRLDPEVLVVTERTAGIANEEPFASTRAGQTNTTVRVNVRDLNQPAPRSVVYVVRNMTRQLYFGPDAAVSASGTATPTTTAGDGPGFTAVGAVVAALVAALVARRRQ
ncbi:PGF-CTERM-anchored ABC transporter substrate-binding protein [Haloarcula sp. S1CR25-12]|uniref:PGF-CTERM-anchored ABC transporter substrate-binding protein n=1 Tax=Haloarcula saliterrae TaxID=2950534 RepID=A0ABU2FAT1_9EURY|nr:PGF-CTERM-anchored ABC transporter substrate-binding protein [Haloarcula sp. S1CR25-12]MDS0259380.1 PGF-CTERM-anchored ABC transporter substrate-binding protein [Haloarcula sp. S1CR25-12]